FTDTLPAADAMYYPIKIRGNCIGVLSLNPQKNIPYLPTELNFIQNVCQLIAVYVDRFISEEKSSVSRYTSEIEKLHNAILHTVSIGFYAPLERVFKVKRQLEARFSNKAIADCVAELDYAAVSLKFIVDNIIVMSELDSGFLHLDKKKIELD